MISARSARLFSSASASASDPESESETESDTESDTVTDSESDTESDSVTDLDSESVTDSVPGSASCGSYAVRLLHGLDRQLRPVQHGDRVVRERLSNVVRFFTGPAAVDPVCRSVANVHVHEGAVRIEAHAGGLERAGELAELGVFHALDAQIERVTIAMPAGAARARAITGDDFDRASRKLLG